MITIEFINTLNMISQEYFLFSYEKQILLKANFKLIPTSSSTYRGHLL